MNYFGVDGVFVSVSGKDSTVLRYIARRLFPEIRSCFCNTGLEYPEIQKFWRAQENVCYVIEQLENTTGDPYHWKIVWYIPIPQIVGG